MVVKKFEAGGGGAGLFISLNWTLTGVEGEGWIVFETRMSFR